MSRSLKKGPFVDTHLLEKIEVMNRGEREEGHQDLVAPLDGDARDGGAHARRAQREEVHPGVRHREHGRPQARRVRADAAVQGAHDEGGREGRGGRAARAGAPARRRRRQELGRAVMIQAQATARYVRTSAQKAGLVLDLIRGKDVNQRARDAAVHAQGDRRATSRRCCGRRLPTRSRRTASAATSTGCSCRRATRTRGRRRSACVRRRWAARSAC